MSIIEIIKHTIDAVATPAISPEFVEIDDNFVESDIEFEERNDEAVVDIVKFVVLNTQFVEVVVTVLVLGFAFVLLDGTIGRWSFCERKIKISKLCISICSAKNNFLFMQPN